MPERFREGDTGGQTQFPWQSALDLRVLPCAHGNSYTRNLSGLRSIAVEDAVENRGLYRVFFRACLKEVLDTIAPLPRV